MSDEYYRQKRRAEDAEAMFLGAVVGSKDVIDLANTKIEKLSANLSTITGKNINNIAEAAAYKRLSEVIVDELQNPEKPKRFSDPSNAKGRALLLEATHKAEIARIQKIAVDAGYQPSEIEESTQKQQIEKSIANYKKLTI